MFPDAEKLVLLEEDLEVSPDFLRYSGFTFIPLFIYLTRIPWQFKWGVHCTAHIFFNALWPVDFLAVQCAFTLERSPKSVSSKKSWTAGFVTRL